MIHSSFSAALLDPALPPPGGIAVRHGADPVRRFGVYRNNVLIALTDALADTYPVVCALVGTEFFRGMAQEYARQHPPRSPVMTEYGDDFADYIDCFAPAAAVPYLSDVARLEWQRVLSFHAADVAPLETGDIAHLLGEPEKLAATQWVFHPSVALVSSSFAVVSLWLAHQHADAITTDSVLGRLDLTQSESALVTRQDLDVLVLNLSVSESNFIRALLAGENLASAMETGSKAPEPLDLTLAFALLLRSGALVAFQ